MPLFSPALTQQLLRIFFATAGRLAPPLGVNVLWRNFSPPRRPLGEEHRAWLDSAEALELPAYRAAPGGEVLRLRGYRWEPAAGPTVLLVHGWGGNSLDFRPLVPGLVAAGYRVTTLDLPAHGRSEGQHTNLLDWREALRAWVAEFGWPSALVAHSLGGLAAALLLAEPGPGGVDRFVYAGSPLSGQMGFEVGFDHLAVPASVRRGFYQRVEAWLRQPIAYFRFAERPQLRAGQVLAIYDSQDALLRWPEVAAYLAANPDIAQFLVPGVGHYRFYRDPAVRERVLDFLSS